MKTTTCLTLRRSLILAILFLLSSAVLTAQVKIHEKVEIAPKAPNIGTIKANDVPGLSNSFILKYPANVELLIPLDGDNYFGNVSCSNGQTVNIYRYIDGPPLSWYLLKYGS